jgi:hypothetical protein
VPEEELPREAHLYLYKIDAIARMMLPEEMASTASKSLLDRMLADLDPPKMQKKQVSRNTMTGALVQGRLQHISLLACMVLRAFHGPWAGLRQTLAVSHML